MRQGRYWAFISYSHADEAWARWLHRRIETWNIPARLVRHPTPVGPAPRRFFPVFRDRAELPSSAELGGVIRQALQDSQWLIVIGSPSAARSRWVDEEIRYFKSLGREQRVLVLVVDGEPRLGGEGSAGAFPPALCRGVDASGVLTEALAEPIAADARPGRDPRPVAVLKLLAGMLGVGYDELNRRERRRQRWRWARNALLASAVVAALAATWQWQRELREQALAEQARAERAQRLVESGLKELSERRPARAAVLLNEARALGAASPLIDLALGLALQPLATLREEFQAFPDVRVSALELDASGRRVAAASVRARQLMVWDRAERRELLRVPLAEAISGIGGLYFSPDGERLLVGLSPRFNEAGEVQVWNLRTARLERRLEGLSLQSGLLLKPAPMDASGRYLVLPRFDGALAWWDLHSEAPPRILRSSAPIRQAVLNPPGTAVYFIDFDGLVHRWRPQGGRPVMVRRTCGDRRPSFLIQQPADGLLVAGCEDGRLSGFDSVDGELRFTGGHRDFIEDLRFGADGRRLLSLSSNALRVWNVRTGALVTAIPNGLSVYSAEAAFARSGERFGRFSGSAAEIWDVDTEALRLSLDGHQGAIRGIRFSPDSREVLTSADDGWVRTWSVDGFPVAQMAHGRSADALRLDGINDLAFSPDGRWMASAGMDTDVRLWDRTGRALRRLEGHESSVATVRFSPDGRELVAPGLDHSVRVWEVDSGRLLHSLRGHEAVVGHAEYGLAGRRLLSLDWASQACLWRLPEGERIECWSYDKVFTVRQSFGFSPDGRRFVLGRDQGVELRDAEDGRLLWRETLPPRTQGKAPRVDFAAFDPSGTRLLVVRDGGTLEWREAASGRLLQHRVSETAQFSQASFDAGGARVVLGSNGPRAWIWTLADNRLDPIGLHQGEAWWTQWHAPSGAVLSAGRDGLLYLTHPLAPDRPLEIGRHSGNAFGRFSPDGGQLVSYGYDNRIRIWNLPGPPPPATALRDWLACRTAWRVQDEALVAQAIRHEGCELGAAP